MSVTPSRAGAAAAARPWFSICLLLAVLWLLLLPNLLWVATANGKYYDFTVPYAIMQGVMPSLLFLVTLTAVFGARPWIAVLLLLPFLPLVPIESAYIVHYGEPTWYAIVATAVESNSREALDFLGPLLWPLAAAVLGALLLGVGAIVSLRRSGVQWRGRSRDLSLAACLTAVVMALVMPAPPRPAKAGQEAPDASGTFVQRLAHNLEPSFPLGVPIRLLHYRAEWQAMKNERDRLRDFRFGATQATPVSARQVYVLIIGEASRAASWHLFGYDRQTTPLLEQRSNLVAFKDAITPWSASRMSVPIIVSRKRGTDPRMFFDERSITRAFAEAGFKTFWMSNQMPVGGYDSPISLVAYDAADTSFWNVADYTNQGNLDEVLLDPLQRALDGAEPRLFIVLHSLGSHENYAYRYPDRFDTFKPSLKGLRAPNFDDPALSERIRNSYDDSILYTDYFIDSVIARVAASGAVATVWYVSDHGEDLITPSCKLSGHGSGTVFNFRVPVLFWYSDAYAAQFPQAVAAAQQHADAPISTENIAESLADTADLNFPGHDPSWSLLSPAWQPHRRLVQPLFGQTTVDFDESTESSACRMVIAR